MARTACRYRRFRLDPPYPWRGPRPEVEAFRAQRMTTLREGERTVAIEAGDWLLKAADGGLVTMSDATFRQWYQTIDGDDDDFETELSRPVEPPRRAGRSRRTRRRRSSLEPRLI